MLPLRAGLLAALVLILPALWADTLGPEGSDGATYLASIASNTKTMVDGVTGGAVSCSLPMG